MFPVSSLVFHIPSDVSRIFQPICMNTVRGIEFCIADVLERKVHMLVTASAVRQIPLHLSSLQGQGVDNGVHHGGLALTIMFVR